MYSVVPLSPEALIAGVCQDHNTDVVDPVDVDINFLLDACQNLIVVDSQLHICRFSHLSVQEYLEKHWGYYDANALIAKVCLSLLNDPVQQKRNTELQDENKELDDIIRYARFCWADHVQNHDKERIASRLAIILKQFLGSFNESSSAYKSWLEIIDTDINKRYLDVQVFNTSLVYKVFHSISPSSLTLLVISAFGFNKIIFDWWETAVFDVETRNKNNESLLHIASRYGHPFIVMILLRKGADVNAQRGIYGNALQAASSRGHEMVVQLLLEKGADINAQGGEYGNALQAASSRGHEAVVHLLLEKGADVNAQGGWYGNALQAASSEGHEAVVQLLLEKGADVNAQGGWYGNALQAASSRGHEAVVQLLLEKGADVNAQGGPYGNALQAASSRGHEAVVQLLLEKGADVNAQGGRLNNALQAASCGGHEKIVQLLLNSKADVNAQGGYLGNALQAASLRGYEEIVQLVLNSGANVNAQGGRFDNALQAASWNGYKAVVQLLLENGADVNAQGGETEKHEVISIFANDERLQPLYSSALKNTSIGATRFEDTFRRLLKRYAKDLDNEAQVGL